MISLTSHRGICLQMVTCQCSDDTGTEGSGRDTTEQRWGESMRVNDRAILNELQFDGFFMEWALFFFSFFFFYPFNQKFQLHGFRFWVFLSFKYQN